MQLQQVEGPPPVFPVSMRLPAAALLAIDVKKAMLATTRGLQAAECYRRLLPLPAATLPPLPRADPHPPPACPAHSPAHPR